MNKQIITPLQNHEGYAMTLAYPILCENDFLKKACAIIALELDRYNLEKTGPLPKRKIVYEESLDSLVEIGEICQHSVIIDNQMNQGTLERILSTEPDFLTVLQVKAREQGARLLFSWSYKDSIVAKIFKQAGFRLCAEFPDLRENLVVQRFYKALDNDRLDLIRQTQLKMIISENFIYESYNELNPCRYEDSISQDFFGIFIHDIEKTSLKAGLFGTVYNNKDKGIPHGEILCLWVEDALRKNGFGTFLMEEAEKFLKHQGAQYIQLATNGFQAPKFYQKMGFEVVESCPNYYRLVDGFYSAFDCTKKL